MHVGIVVYGLDRPLSGVTRVTLELGRALRDSGLCRVTFLTPHRTGPLTREDGSAAWLLTGCQRLPAMMALGGPLISLAASRLGLDLVHDPAGISPFTLGRWAGAYRRVVTVHDAIAFRYPEGYPALNNFLHRRYMPATLRNVDHVITVSCFSRSDVTRMIHLQPENISIVPLAINSAFGPLAPANVKSALAAYGLQPQGYILGMAQQRRKNLGGLLAAFARVHADFPHVRLAIAGQPLFPVADPKAWLTELGIDGAVTFLGYVPEATLPALYSGAAIFAFPSLYEGFGLPVLEAMACGAPVVCSNTTSLPEVAGDAALLVQPCSVDELAGAMKRLLVDDALRQSLSSRGLARAAGFTWEECARQTAAIYERTLERRP